MTARKAFVTYALMVYGALVKSKESFLHIFLKIINHFFFLEKKKRKKIVTKNSKIISPRLKDSVKNHSFKKKMGLGKSMKMKNVVKKAMKLKLTSKK